MDKHFAAFVKSRALQSVACLTEILAAPEFGGLEAAEQDHFKRVLGLLIGDIQLKFLNDIYERYPELDDIQ